MPFKKTSLKSIARKRQIKTGTKKMGTFSKIAGIAAISLLFVLPKFIAMAFRKERYPLGARVARTFLGITLIVAGGVSVFALTDIGNRTGKAFVKETIFALGAELPTDEHGLTNVLLLGVGGGEAHAQKGHKLTDSMMVASFDVTGKSAVLLSIPRDFYVQTPYVRGRINEIVRDESAVFLKELRNLPEHSAKLQALKGQERIEYIWKLEAEADRRAENDLKAEIEKILDLKIHRIARIDFRGFEKGVDAIGGIDVVVEKAISDPTYPDFEWGYDPFTLAAGPQHLDGSTALKYARSRHDSSDFDRAKRQQQVIGAIKDKLTSMQVFSSPSKLKGLFDVIQSNFISDISWEEMITLAELGSKMPRERIVSFVLNNNDMAPGGFLVTPDRSLYGGAYVLVPFTNMQEDKYAQIRAFAAIIFEHRGISIFDPPEIEILNGTNISGLAGTLQLHFERYGWKIARVDNLEEPAEKTVIRITDTPKNRVAAELMANFIRIEIEIIPSPTPTVDDTSASPAAAPVDVFQVVLGKDYEKPFRTPYFPPAHE